MNRRVFLTSLGTLSVAGFAAAALPATLQAGGDIPRFKVVGSGRLLVSNDGGRTWHPSIHLGPDVTVTGISREGQDTHLALSFQGHAFALRSADGIKWRTRD
jgi:hypothetical protein